MGTWKLAAASFLVLDVRLGQAAWRKEPRKKIPLILLLHVRSDVQCCTAFSY